MRVALGEIPEVAGVIVGDFSLAFWVDDGHLAMAGQNVGPLCRIVPMHLPNATGIEIQMRPRDIGSDGQTLRGDVPRPAAGRCLDGSLVERSRKRHGIT